MKRVSAMKHVFVEHVPERPDDGILYVSVKFGTVVHNCCCGCGNEVVTPLSPTDWQLIFDGESVSLDPSIGNWSFDCRSHYWIENGRVHWADQWTADEVRSGRERDRRAKQRYFGELEVPHDQTIPGPATDRGSETQGAEKGWLFRLTAWFLR